MLETATKKLAHIALLDEIDFQARRKTATATNVVLSLTSVLERMAIPEPEMSAVITRLKAIQEGLVVTGEPPDAWVISRGHISHLIDILSG